jgi:hypothetical protein
VPPTWKFWAIVTLSTGQLSAGGIKLGSPPPDPACAPTLGWWPVNESVDMRTQHSSRSSEGRRGSTTFYSNYAAWFHYRQPRPRGVTALVPLRLRQVLQTYSNIFVGRCNLQDFTVRLPLKCLFLWLLGDDQPPSTQQVEMAATSLTLTDGHPSRGFTSSTSQTGVSREAIDFLPSSFLAVAIPSRSTHRPLHSSSLCGVSRNQCIAGPLNAPDVCRVSMSQAFSFQTI